MERGLTMLFHSALIALIAYGIMIFLLKQKQSLAENRSLVLFSIILLYMIIFGHNLPIKINPNLI